MFGSQGNPLGGGPWPWQSRVLPARGLRAALAWTWSLSFLGSGRVRLTFWCAVPKPSSVCSRWRGKQRCQRSRVPSAGRRGPTLSPWWLGRPSGAGQPAGLENSLGPSLLAPKTQVCGREGRTLSMSLTFTPQHGPPDLSARGDSQNLSVITAPSVQRHSLPSSRVCSQLACATPGEPSRLSWRQHALA